MTTMFNRLNKKSVPMTPEVVTPVQKQKQEKIRSCLQKELGNVVRAAITSPHSRRENIPSEITQNLCNSIEAMFIHGLRDPFFLKGTRYAKYPEPNFWPFVSKLSHRSIINQISSLGQIRSEIGKCRAWIRIVLNENALSQYLDVLASESTAIQQFYSEGAFLRLLADTDQSERIRGLLKPLGTLPISAATNSSFLNTWTPTPLILSGLMAGEPLKVGTLKARPNPKPVHVTEEIAIPAIDVLVHESEQDIGSPSYNERRRKRAMNIPVRKSENDNNSECSSVYSHPSLLDSGEMSYQHAINGNRKRIPGMRPVPSNQRIQLPQSPLFSSTPIETTILDQLKIPKRSSDFVQTVSHVSDAPPGYQPLIISRRIRRPSKQKSNSMSSSESVSRDSKKVTEPISTRDSRANSDMPSTIFGTVPNDVAFSPDEIHNFQVQSKPISTTIDSGIADIASSSAGAARICSEIERNEPYASNESFEGEEEIQGEQSVSFLDALHDLESTAEEEIPPPRSLSLTDDILNKKTEETSDQTDETHIQEPEEGSDVSINPEEGTSAAVVPTSEGAAVPRSQPVPIPVESHRQLHRAQQKKDSILGTSLRDELLEVLPSGEDGTFDNGTPNYVQSPLLMGNSLAAIGARNQMWESNSERMSSSSGSGGPVASFGQALRSAMVVRGEHDENQAMTESIGASSQDLAEHDESVNEVDSASGSRKSSVSAETSEKLCRIPREKGLDSQDFRCAMCRKTIGGPTFAKFETCAIDSKYYCTECMKTGGKVSIPARVVMDWDWRERPVSDRGRAWFEANQEKALINIQETNPRLYTHVPALAETRKLREKLHLVSMYLFACRDSVAEDFRRRLWPKEYLRSDIDLYSFADLMDVKSGALQRRLNHLFKHSVNHVMSCILCQQKGFCCELCSVPEVLYPFHTETTHRCPVCFSVFHVHCWRSSDQCPKCERRRIFEISRAEINDPHNSLLVLQP